MFERELEIFKSEAVIVPEHKIAKYNTPKKKKEKTVE